MDGASGYGWALSIWSKEVTFPVPGAGAKQTDSDPVCCHKGPEEAQLSSGVRSRQQRRRSSLPPSLGVPSKAWGGGGLPKQPSPALWYDIILALLSRT